ncbi:MAG TPA: TylF/MycF/NovP-related O-methyltransferase [Candidatus Sulfotelmatobacter sp.]|nr:TylF/MycF/NovP-related O-methyltransferase [Candidatus Sulfotelmatobacter sp.]
MIRKLLDRILIFFGIKTIRIYESTYFNEKYTNSVAELSEIFREFLFPNLSQNNLRVDLLKQLYGTSISEALYIIGYLEKTSGLKGDVCEFGIANGATSALIANEIKRVSKHLWLFDSFKGLSEPTRKDILLNDIFNLGSMNSYKGSMAYSKIDVKTRLKKLHFPARRTHIIEGYIEKTISRRDLPKKISFAYVDFDLYEPTKIALKFLHKKIQKSGYMVIDDYNFFSEGVKTAVSEFLNLHKKDYKLIIPPAFAGKFCILYKK